MSKEKLNFIEKAQFVADFLRRQKQFEEELARCWGNKSDTKQAIVAKIKGIVLEFEVSSKRSPADAAIWTQSIDDLKELQYKIQLLIDDESQKDAFKTISNSALFNALIMLFAFFDRCITTKKSQENSLITPHLASDFDQIFSDLKFGNKIANFLIASNNLNKVIYDEIVPACKSNARDEDMLEERTQQNFNKAVEEYKNAYLGLLEAMEDIHVDDVRYKSYHVYQLPEFKERYDQSWRSNVNPELDQIMVHGLSVDKVSDICREENVNEDIQQRYLIYGTHILLAKVGEKYVIYGQKQANNKLVFTRICDFNYPKSIDINNLSKEILEAVKLQYYKASRINIEDPNVSILRALNNDGGLPTHGFRDKISLSFAMELKTLINEKLGDENDTQNNKQYWRELQCFCDLLSPSQDIMGNIIRVQENFHLESLRFLLFSMTNVFDVPSSTLAKALSDWFAIMHANALTFDNAQSHHPVIIPAAKMQSKHKTPEERMPASTPNTGLSQPKPPSSDMSQ